MSSAGSIRPEGYTNEERAPAMSGRAEAAQWFAVSNGQRQAAVMLDTAQLH